jgi:antitoxin (DNA-binding transcriptional repressor) of toxin-antitoxin stability system
MASQAEDEVGIWALRARLGLYLELVEQGREVIVTRRGRRIARMSRLGDPLGHLDG